MEQLKACDATVLDAGEAIIIQTPTAGGYGAKWNRLGGGIDWRVSRSQNTSACVMNNSGTITVGMK